MYTDSECTAEPLDVVRIAVGNNASLIAARQRLELAQELIAQVDAQGRPQFGGAAYDFYSTYKTFPPQIAYPIVQSPVVPGGGTIPTVVDAAGNFPTSFLGGAGVAGLSNAGVNSPGINEPTAAASMGEGATEGSPGAPSSGDTAARSPGAGGGAPTAQAAARGDVPKSLLTPAIVADYLTEPMNGKFGAVDAKNFSITEISPSRSDPTSGAQPSPAIDDAKSAGSDATDDREAEQATSNSSGNQTVSAPATNNNNLATRLSVSQLIDLFGVLPAARGVEKDYRDFYALDIRRLQNETALAAKNLFFNLLLSQAQMATEQEQVDYATEDVRITQDRFTQGIVSNFDVLTAKTSLSTAQQQLIAAQDQQDLAQASLAYLLGTDPNKQLQLAAPPLPPLDQPVDVAQSTSVGLADRPEIAQAKSNIREAEGLVKVARSGLLPAVGVAAVGYDNSSATSTVPQSYAEVIAQITAPLDDGGATRSRVRASKVAVQAQSLALEELQESVGLEVRQAIVNIRNAQAQVGAAQTGVAQAQEALRLARERYQAGLGTLLDVLNALAQLGVTRTNLSNAQYFYQSSLAQLVRAIGGY